MLLCTIQVSVGDVICPDKKEECHHDTTCCATASGDYGCCPLPAVSFLLCTLIQYIQCTWKVLRILKDVV